MNNKIQSNIKRPKKIRKKNQIRRKTKYNSQTQKFGGGVPSFLPTHIVSLSDAKS
jgi:hypothetical protein